MQLPDTAPHRALDEVDANLARVDHLLGRSRIATCACAVFLVGALVVSAIAVSAVWPPRESTLRAEPLAQ